MSEVPAVSLREFVGEMQLGNDQSYTYLHRPTGAFVLVAEGELYGAPENALDGYDPRRDGSLTDWLDGSDDYLVLPTQFEIHEYNMLVDFADALEDEDLRDTLLSLLRGSGAFQRFKSAIRRYDLEDQWYRFRDLAYKEIALDWMQDHGVAYVDDVEPAPEAPRQLRPVVASYAGGSAARQYLTDEVLQVVARVAQAPRPVATIPEDVLAELQAMHVVATHDGQVRLDTAVFFREDMERIVEVASPLAEELAGLILANADALREAPPAVTLFLGGLIGLVQGMGRALGEADAAIWAWRGYTGKYARTKVDFDEVCDLNDAIGPDVLNKTVLQGERHTAVFMGPGGANFERLIWASATEEHSRAYLQHLNRYLVDAYAMLISGELRHPDLLAAADAAGIFRNGQPRPAVVTAQDMPRYEPAIRAITEVSSAFYRAKRPVLDALLRDTASGRQGVSPANMSMHLWRYLRRLTARMLYANGFFRDGVPQEGCLTVFYKNDIAMLRELLG
jgi:hypothetical protein